MQKLEETSINLWLLLYISLCKFDTHFVVLLSRGLRCDVCVCVLCQRPDALHVKSRELSVPQWNGRMGEESEEGEVPIIVCMHACT